MDLPPIHLHFEINCFHSYAGIGNNKDKKNIKKRNKKRQSRKFSIFKNKKNIKTQKKLVLCLNEMMLYL